MLRLRFSLDLWPAVVLLVVIGEDDSVPIREVTCGCHEAVSWSSNVSEGQVRLSAPTWRYVLVLPVWFWKHSRRLGWQSIGWNCKLQSRTLSPVTAYSCRNNELDFHPCYWAERVQSRGRCSAVHLCSLLSGGRFWSWEETVQGGGFHRAAEKPLNTGSTAEGKILNMEKVTAWDRFEWISKIFT